MTNFGDIPSNAPIPTDGIADNAITETKIATSVAGDGLAGGGGSALSVNTDNATIEKSGDTLRVKPAGLTIGQMSANTGWTQLAERQVRFDSSSPVGFSGADSDPQLLWDADGLSPFNNWGPSGADDSGLSVLWIPDWVTQVRLVCSLKAGIKNNTGNSFNFGLHRVIPGGTPTAATAGHPAILPGGDPVTHRVTAAGFTYTPSGNYFSADSGAAGISPSGNFYALTLATGSGHVVGSHSFAFHGSLFIR